jgi:hypothetical protein
VSDPLVIGVTLAIIVETAIAVWCAWQNRQRYLHRPGESRVWDTLVVADLRVAIAGVIILLITIYGLLRSVFEWPPLPPPWPLLGLAAALALLMYGPIAHWWMFQRIERERP